MSGTPQVGVISSKFQRNAADSILGRPMFELSPNLGFKGYGLIRFTIVWAKEYTRNLYKLSTIQFLGPFGRPILGKFPCGKKGIIGVFWCESVWQAAKQSCCSLTVASTNLFGHFTQGIPQCLAPLLKGRGYHAPQMHRLYPAQALP